MLTEINGEPFIETCTSAARVESSKKIDTAIIKFKRIVTDINCIQGGFWGNTCVTIKCLCPVKDIYAFHNFIASK